MNDNFLDPSASVPGEEKFLVPADRFLFVFAIRKYLNNFLDIIALQVYCASMLSLVE